MAGSGGQRHLHGGDARPWWLLFVVAATTAFVRGYEEPTLRRQFPDDYDAYVAAVPGRVPRFRARELKVRG